MPLDNFSTRIGSVTCKRLIETSTSNISASDTQPAAVDLTLGGSVTLGVSVSGFFCAILIISFSLIVFFSSPAKLFFNSLTFLLISYLSSFKSTFLASTGSAAAKGDDIRRSTFIKSSILRANYFTSRKKGT